MALTPASQQARHTRTSKHSSIKSSTELTNVAVNSVDKTRVKVTETQVTQLTKARLHEVIQGDTRLYKTNKATCLVQVTGDLIPSYQYQYTHRTLGPIPYLTEQHRDPFLGSSHSSSYSSPS